MSGLEIALLSILSLCILASGFLSGSETALVAIPRERVHRLETEDRRGRRLAELTGDPERMLGTILLANNFVNILAASVATVLAIELVGETWGPWLATFVITAIILVVGEITPKTLATRHPERFALTVATPVYYLGRALHPLSQVFIASSRVILRSAGVSDRGRPIITEDDIRAMAALGEIEGEIHAEEREIIESLFELADRPVRDVMTPRIDVVSLELPITEEDVREAVAATGHSRYLVRQPEEGLDKVAGVLYVKDLLRAKPGLSPEEIRATLRDPIFVPESTPILDMIRRMRTRRFGFAIVVDEHGGVEGLITIKDLMSELVGEIQDEYDPRVPSMVTAGKGVWIADGRIPVDELSETIGVQVPEGPYSTVGGMYLALAGEIPDEGDQIDLNGTLKLTVLRMDRHRIDRVRIEKVEDGS
jgi:CBS domain containing-hemolysin-like protein